MATEIEAHKQVHLVRAAIGLPSVPPPAELLEKVPPIDEDGAELSDNLNLQKAAKSYGTWVSITGFCFLARIPGVSTHRNPRCDIPESVAVARRALGR